jgi:hypothetical protein
MVHTTAEVLQSIGHHEIGHPEHRVVSGGLLECALGDGNYWRLAFHQHQGSTGSVTNHHIRPLSATVIGQPVLHQGAPCRIPQVMDQVVHEMLAHPFLGRKRNPLSPDGIEDLRSSGIVLSFDAVVRQG